MAVAAAGVVYCLMQGFWVAAALIVVVPAAVGWFSRKALQKALQKTMG